MPRAKIPTRSDNVPQRTKYQDYKDQLRLDFAQRCGYCDDWDRFYGGKPGYHIDHFAPKKRFPALELAYSNLVYSCPFCNRGKSDKWVGADPAISHNGQEGFLDPCSAEYDDHIERDANGRFISSGPLGAYMISHLRLYLERHQYIWAIQNLTDLRARALKLLPRIDKAQPHYTAVLEEIAAISIEIDEYSDDIFGAAA